jgi:hypothetical protein
MESRKEMKNKTCLSNKILNHEKKVKKGFIEKITIK